MFEHGRRHNAFQLNFVVMDSGLDASHRPGMTEDGHEARSGK
jgi:hypothetical protein